MGYRKLRCSFSIQFEPVTVNLSVPFLESLSLILPVSTSYFSSSADGYHSYLSSETFWYRTGLSSFYACIHFVSVVSLYLCVFIMCEFSLFTLDIHHFGMPRLVSLDKFNLRVFSFQSKESSLPF